MIVWLALAAPAHADIVRVASVIDGDTLEIHGQRIRLDGIDAPESSQTCRNETGQKWRCDQRAALAPQDLIGERAINCDERDVDRYGRIIGRCLVGGLDTNEWLVTQGLALAYRRYSHDYVATEDQAREAGVGMWAATLELRGRGGTDGEGQRRPVADRTGRDGLEALGLPNRPGGKRAA
jgi:endonuclease YncB( thermonuclease family)